MKAMILKSLCNLKENQTPLELMELPVPVPAENEILLKVSTCGVCHTELDEIEGRTPPRQLPVVLGHQVVGRVEAVGRKVATFKKDDRVGVAWIFSACGKCKFCLSDHENLCIAFKATGRDANGGYAQYMTVAENFAYRIPKFFSDEKAAPLLCRASGFKDGETPVSEYRSICFCQKCSGKDICLGTWCCMGRRHPRSGTE
jgi:propanol-preferring alcohol dehydrogenase